MAQENQEDNSVDPSTLPARRKRGRPWKDGTPGSEPSKRTRRHKVDLNAHNNDPLLGRTVSGVLDGKFDAGYMLSVRVGDTGTVLRGVVFEPDLSVPISAADDVTPNAKMFKREKTVPSTEAWSQRPVVKKDRVVKHRQRNVSALSSKGTSTNPVTEDLNSKVQIHPSVETKSPQDSTNYVPKDVTQDLQSAISDHVQDLKSTISAESPKTAHLQEAFGNTSPITQTLWPSTSEPKQEQAAETLDVKPIITNGPSDDFGKALPVTTEASEHETKEMVELNGNGASLPARSSIGVSGFELSDKILLGNEATEGTTNSTRQESQVHIEALGTEYKSSDTCSEPKSQPSELKPQVLASPEIPEQ